MVFDTEKFFAELEANEQSKRTVAGKAEMLMALMNYVDPETGEPCPLITPEQAKEILLTFEDK